MSLLYNRPVELYLPENGAEPFSITRPDSTNPNPPIRLSYFFGSTGGHYNAIVDLNQPRTDPTTMGKATIIILDASQSMRKPFPTSGSEQTQLDAAKDSIQSYLKGIMNQVSRDRQVGCIILHSPTTKHHLQGEADESAPRQFENLYEFAMQTPTDALIREVGNINCSSKPITSGTFVEGIQLAASLLSAHGTFSSSNILLYTDAAQPISIEYPILDKCVIALRKLSTRIEVMGLNFKRSVKYLVTFMNLEDAASNSDKVVGDYEKEAQGQCATPEATIKQENEQFLMGLLKFTSGKITACTASEHLLVDPGSNNASFPVEQDEPPIPAQRRRIEKSIGNPVEQDEPPRPAQRRRTIERVSTVENTSYFPGRKRFCLLLMVELNATCLEFIEVCKTNCSTK